MSRCQMEAIRMEGSTAFILRERCIGCGLCVPTCPEEALRLEQKPEEERYTPPPNRMERFRRITAERMAKAGRPMGDSPRGKVIYRQNRARSRSFPAVPEYGPWKMQGSEILESGRISSARTEIPALGDSRVLLLDPRFQPGGNTLTRNDNVDHVLPKGMLHQVGIDATLLFLGDGQASPPSDFSHAVGSVVPHARQEHSTGAILENRDALRNRRLMGSSLMAHL